MSFSSSVVSDYVSWYTVDMFLKYIRQIFSRKPLTREQIIKSQVDYRVKQMKYQSFIKRGLSPDEAARRMRY